MLTKSPEVWQCLFLHEAVVLLQHEPVVIFLVLSFTHTLNQLIFFSVGARS